MTKLNCNQMENVHIYMDLKNNLKTVLSLIDTYGGNVSLQDLKEYLISQQIIFERKLFTKDENQGN